jgi:23S rRNA (pseudouridine1915-N3)-methyltransferase
VAREILIVWVGRRLRSPWETLCADYRERIRRHAPVREVQVKLRAGGDDRSRRRAEGRALLDALPSPCWAVALDRRGRARDSLSLARWLVKRRTDWPHPLAFLVGSDLGLSREIRESAREALSLGPLTLPHELARLTLYEQIYRGLSIEAGIKYHRQPL